MNILVKKGEVFGRLTVLNEIERKILPSGQTNRIFNCLCECGNEKTVRLVHLRRGRIQSCGCIKRTQKGLSKTPIYKLWKGMHERVAGRVYKSECYVRRNIGICSEWNEFTNFYEWANDIYVSGMHLDRIDNNKGYSPDNCRFTTPVINQNNKENTRIVSYNGKKYPFCLLLRDKGLFENYGAIVGRIKRGWSIEKSIDTPIRIGKYTRANRTT